MHRRRRYVHIIFYFFFRMSAVSVRKVLVPYILMLTRRRWSKPMLTGENAGGLLD